ncbi:hypothetical protein LguiB_031177 [Lonicera macranthoides]
MMLKVDEEDFVGHGALLQEGLFASNSLSACMDCSIQFGAFLTSSYVQSS